MCECKKPLIQCIVIYWTFWANIYKAYHEPSRLKNHNNIKDALQDKTSLQKSEKLANKCNINYWRIFFRPGEAFLVIFTHRTDCSRVAR